MTQTASFADLGVHDDIARALAEDGITTPFPIQEQTLPLALSGADVIGQARTGTGKTLAFGIPVLQRIDVAARRPQALVIVPTRELCLQVHDDLVQAGSHLGTVPVAIFGGRPIEPQSAALRDGAHVVVGTPGRLLDLLRRGDLDLSHVGTLVLDEADEMLDLGFLPDVEQLIEACPTQRQTLLFSATMPSEVVGLARRYMSKPTFMRADVEEPRIAPATRQYFLSCHRLDKPAVLARILETPERERCLVFTRTKRMADILVEELAQHGKAASAIHSDLRQETRERTLRRFRDGTVDVLCATEVAARGLDIPEVTHVINYDCPDDEKMYLHRIGRTGRAGASGVAITLAVWNELARVEVIKRALGIDAPTHEVFSTSPELEGLFDLPPREAPERRAAGTSRSRDASRSDGGRRSRSGAATAGTETAPRPSSEPSGRRRSRRGGRSRNRSGTQDAQQRDAATAQPAEHEADAPTREASTPAREANTPAREASTPAREASTPAREASTPDREAAGDGATEHTRVRRRTRSRQDARAAEPGEDRTARTADGDGDGDDAGAVPDAGEATSARTRRRVRRRTGTAAPARPAADERRDRAASDVSESTSRPPRGTGGDGASGKGATQSDSSSGNRGSGRDGDQQNARRSNRGSGRGGSRRDGGGSSRQGGGGSSRQGGRGGGSTPGAGRGRSTRDGGRRGDASERRVEPAAARGQGRPALTRPMTINHLP